MRSKSQKIEYPLDLAMEYTLHFIMVGVSISNGLVSIEVEAVLPVLIVKQQGFSTRTACVEAYKTVRDMSFRGRFVNMWGMPGS